MMRETDKAWSAGIIDGEGHLSIERYNGSTTFGIRVGNTDRRMLEKLQRLWGGGICFNFRPDRPTAKPFWIWYVKGKKNAYPCILQIMPYLVTKQERAKDVIDYAISRWGMVRSVTKNLKKSQ